MTILRNLAFIFTLIFALCVLFTLFGTLIYILWKLKRSRPRRSKNDDVESGMSKIASNCFWCEYRKKSRSQTDPAGNGPSLSEVARDSEPDSAEDDADVEKTWQAHYGNSMLLYTIKEEDKEGTEIGSDYSGVSSTEWKNRRIFSRDGLAARVSSEIRLAAVDEMVEPETPYFTPFHSPDHEFVVIPAENDVAGEEKIMERSFPAEYDRR